MTKILMYRIFTILILLFSFANLLAQPPNDNCANALTICPNTPLSSSNRGSTAECGTAEGDCIQNSPTGTCYNVSNSVWFTFTTNSVGGNFTLSFTGVSCATAGGMEASLFSATTPCIPPYSFISCSAAPSKTDFMFIGVLSANTKYWVNVDGELTGGAPGECDFSITVSGDAVKDTIFVATQDVICEQSRGSVTITGNPGPYTLNGGAEQTANTFTELTKGTYIAEAKNVDGCPIRNTFTIIETENKLSVSAGDDHIILPGGKVTLEASTTRDSVIWSPATGLSDPAIKKPIASPLVTTTYTVTVFSPEGCTATDKVIVFVSPPLKIFNTFTPNDDGKNDTWKIINIDQYPEAKISIYDRWGQRVFYSKGYEEEWQGLSLGKPLPAGTYFYVIDLNINSDDEKLEIYKGPVTIVR